MIVYCKNISIVHDQEDFLKEKTIEALKNGLWQQISGQETKLTDSLLVYDVKRKEYTLSQLVKEGARLGLYIDQSQCESCWQEAMDYLKSKHIKKINNMNPFVLAGGYDVRDFRLLNHRHEISIPIYSIKNVEGIRNLTKNNKPFYFFLESNGTISNVFYPDKLYSVFCENYFETMSKKCEMELRLLKRFPRETNKGLELLNSQMDIGEVSVRKKRIVVFELKNIGTQACQILDVQTSCDCITLVSRPQIILSGETETIEADFLSTDIGEMERFILIYTNLRDEPYRLNIKAKVV